MIYNYLDYLLENSNESNFLEIFQRLLIKDTLSGNIVWFHKPGLKKIDSTLQTAVKDLNLEVKLLYGTLRLKKKGVELEINCSDDLLEFLTEYDHSLSKNNLLYFLSM